MPIANIMREEIGTQRESERVPGGVYTRGQPGDDDRDKTHSEKGRSNLPELVWDSGLWSNAMERRSSTHGATFLGFMTLRLSEISLSQMATGSGANAQREGEKELSDSPRLW